MLDTSIKYQVKRNNESGIKLIINEKLKCKIIASAWRQALN